MKKFVDKKNWTRYNEIPPRKTSGGLQKKKKKEKKVLTKDKTRAMITELRPERPTNRTLTNKQQCNPEDSKTVTEKRSFEVHGKRENSEKAKANLKEAVKKERTASLTGQDGSEVP